MREAAAFFSGASTLAACGVLAAVVHGTPFIPVLDAGIVGGICLVITWVIVLAEGRRR